MDKHCQYRKSNWDFDDQVVNSDFDQMGEVKNSERSKVEDDDVFLSHEFVDDELENSLLMQLRRAALAQSQPTPVVERKHSFCPAQWSVSHRCIDCAWKKQRGGRPKHPPPPISPGCSSPPMVTLQSLSTTRDSGYEPSPTSAYSFTFSDDDEIDKGIESGDVEESICLSVNSGHLVASGITPPINIPARTFGITDIRSSRSSRSKNKTRAITPIKLTRRDEIPTGAFQFTPHKKVSIKKRSSSAPELGGNELVLQRAPLIIRNANLLKTPFSDKITPIHGRNYSLPVTTPDGRPLLSPPLSTPSSRASREGLIDLAEEDPEGSLGHRRRVLVLALPDLVVDSRRGDAHNCSPLSSFEASTSRWMSRQPSESQSARPSCSSDSSGFEATGFSKPRPAWSRPRALSCDVTLEVEVGQGLRRIADDFSYQTVVEFEGGVWRQLQNTFARRFSLGAIMPVPEGSSDNSSSSARGSHSLPSTPSRTDYRSDSDFDEFADFSE